MALLLELLWKMLATAGLIIAIARVAGRIGPFMASVLITIPLNAGPGFLFIALKADADFVSRGALYALASAGAVLLFMTVCARQLHRHGLLRSLVLASLAWCLPVLVLLQLPLDLVQALISIALGALLARLLRPKLPPVTAPPILRNDWLMLLVRATSAGLAVASIAAASAWLGPERSGLLLGYPIILATSAWVLQRRYGGLFAATTLLHAQRAQLTYISFCLGLYLLAGPLTAVAAVFAAFALALGVAAILATLAWRARFRPASGHADAADTGQLEGRAQQVDTGVQAEQVELDPVGHTDGEPQHPPQR